MNDSDAQKLLGKPWQRGEMQHTCMADNSFSFKCLQDFLLGERASIFHHLIVSLDSLTISGTKPPCMENYSVLTSAYSLSFGSQFWLSGKSCSLTAKQRRQLYVHTRAGSTTFPSYTTAQLWQLLTLGPALSTRRGEPPCKQLLQSAFSFPWGVIKANFAQDCPQRSETGTWNSLSEHASRRSHSQSSAVLHSGHRRDGINLAMIIGLNSLCQTQTILESYPSFFFSFCASILRS